MKKKILSYLLYAMTALPLGGVGGGLLTSCSLKEDADFGETASQRSEAHIAAIEELLPTATNGWLVEYYGNLGFGGYNMMMKFTSDSVTVASEKFGPSHLAGLDSNGKCITTTSAYTHYKMEQSMGSILSFDDYNETFHYFSMPDNPDYSYDKAEGLYGDFEFRVIEASKDSIVLRGKKHNNRILMTPIPADKTWESYITEAKETEEYMSSSKYFLTGADRKDDIEIVATSNAGYRCFVFTYTDTLDMKQTVTAPYIVNAEGFKFYAPVEVNGMVLNGLIKGDTQDYFLFRNNQNLQLDTYMPPLSEHLNTELWYFNYDDVGDYARPKWDAMMEILKTAGKNKDKITIYTATIGRLNDKNIGSSLSTSDAIPYWYMTTKSSEDGLTITFNQKSTGTNRTDKAYYNNYLWKDVLNCIYGHTFKLTTNNMRHPSYITMTDEKDPTNVITIYASARYFMNDQSYYDN